MTSDLLERRQFNPIREPLAQHGIYHSFVLPDGRVLNGAMSLQHQMERLESFGLPERLDGTTLLDIGPWDGFYTFEMERRGAQVTAIDYVDLDTFRLLHGAFQSKAKYLRMDVSELNPAELGPFDITLCLGVLYHLRYPIEGLEKICAVTSDICIVDTFVIDGKEWLEGRRPPLPSAEFYERMELAGQMDNWWGPTVSAVEAWLRAAGFAQVFVQRVTNSSACFKAHRKWTGLPPDREAPVLLKGIHHHQNRGRTFQSAKEEYIEMWTDWQDAAPPALSDVYPEVDGFGVAPLFCSVGEGRLQTAIRVPPGLQPGRHWARLKIGGMAWSEPGCFYLDIPPAGEAPHLLSAQDGISWEEGVADWSRGGWLTLWVQALSEEADPGNVTVLIAGIPHTPHAVDAKTGQVNVQLRPLIPAGKHEAGVVHRGVAGNTIGIEVRGHPPAIRGLEALAEGSFPK